MSKIVLFFFSILCLIFNIKTTMSQTVVDFSSENTVDSWQIVNDDVMGGISKSDLYYHNDNYAVFSGNISLQNNGGFASIRNSFSSINVYSKKSIKLEIKGDGKDYQIRIKKNRNDYYSYVKNFSTNNKWQLITLELSDFYPSFRGRRLNFDNFDESYFQQISILIANNIEENFRLYIKKIYLD